MRGRRTPVAGTPDHIAPDQGATLADVVVSLALVAVLGGLTVPVTARALEVGRVRHAAGLLASALRDARQRAAFRASSAGVVFDQTSGGWTFRLCLDGNRNGLRRSEIDDGTDTCPEGPVAISDVFRGVAIAVDPTLRGPAGEAGSPDAVRFGSSDLASFSPDGNASPGTVFLRSVGGTQYCVRIGGISGRTRVLRYDPGRRTWRS